MKILVAPDKFKGAITAPSAAQALVKGVNSAASDHVSEPYPMGDGGEGTMEALVQALGGTYYPVAVHDPLMRPIEASFAMLADGETAYVEMAAASGLYQLAVDEQNCYHTTSYGTGELIRAALDAGAREVMLGLGGSATSDGGAGMASALGVNFYASDKLLKAPAGKDLPYITDIEVDNVDKRLAKVTVTILCDVQNNLLGSDGAAYTYAPQKGAHQTEVEHLEAGLQQLANLLTEKTNADTQKSGAGAAGGMGFGAEAILDGTLKPGVEAVMQSNGFEQALASADLVITGEGKLDATTAKGKVVAGVAAKAREHNLAVAALCGQVEADNRLLADMGLTYSQSITTGPVSEHDSLKNTYENLIYAATQVVNLFEKGLEYGKKH